MLEVALRAAVLHDASGRTLRSLGDLVGALPPVDPDEPAAEPPALPAELALAEAVSALLSGPHAAASAGGTPTDIASMKIAKSTPSDAALAPT